MRTATELTYINRLLKSEQHARSIIRRRRDADILTRYQAGQSVTEIALALGIHTSTVSRKIHRLLTRS